MKKCCVGTRKVKRINSFLKSTELFSNMNLTQKFIAVLVFTSHCVFLDVQLEKSETIFIKKFHPDFVWQHKETNVSVTGEHLDDITNIKFGNVECKIGNNCTANALSCEIQPSYQSGNFSTTLSTRNGEIYSEPKFLLFKEPGKIWWVSKNGTKTELSGTQDGGINFEINGNNLDELESPALSLQYENAPVHRLFKCDSKTPKLVKCKTPKISKNFYNFPVTLQWVLRDYAGKYGYIEGVGSFTLHRNPSWELFTNVLHKYETLHFHGHNLLNSATIEDFSCFVNDEPAEIVQVTRDTIICDPTDVTVALKKNSLLIVKIVVGNTERISGPIEYIDQPILQSKVEEEEEVVFGTLTVTDVKIIIFVIVAVFLLGIVLLIYIYCKNCNCCQSELRSRVEHLESVQIGLRQLRENFDNSNSITSPTPIRSIRRSSRNKSNKQNFPASYDIIRENEISEILRENQISIEEVRPISHVYEAIDEIIAAKTTKNTPKMTKTRNQDIRHQKRKQFVVPRDLSSSSDYTIPKFAKSRTGAIPKRNTGAISKRKTSKTMKVIAEISPAFREREMMSLPSPTVYETMFKPSRFSTAKPMRKKTSRARKPEPKNVLPRFTFNEEDYKKTKTEIAILKTPVLNFLKIAESNEEGDYSASLIGPRSDVTSDYSDLLTHDSEKIVPEKSSDYAEILTLDEKASTPTPWKEFREHFALKKGELNFDSSDDSTLYGSNAIAKALEFKEHYSLNTDWVSATSDFSFHTSNDEGIYGIVAPIPGNFRNSNYDQSMETNNSNQVATSTNYDQAANSINSKKAKAVVVLKESATNDKLAAAFNDYKQVAAGFTENKQAEALMKFKQTPADFTSQKQAATFMDYKQAAPAFRDYKQAATFTDDKQTALKDYKQISTLVDINLTEISTNNKKIETLTNFNQASTSFKQNLSEISTNNMHSINSVEKDKNGLSKRHFDLLQSRAEKPNDSDYFDWPVQKKCEQRLKVFEKFSKPYAWL